MEELEFGTKVVIAGFIFTNLVSLIYFIIVMAYLSDAEGQRIRHYDAIRLHLSASDDQSEGRSIVLAECVHRNSEDVRKDISLLRRALLRKRKAVKK